MGYLMLAKKPGATQCPPECCPSQCTLIVLEYFHPAAKRPCGWGVNTVPNNRDTVRYLHCSARAGTSSSLDPLIKLAPPFHPFLDGLGAETRGPQVSAFSLSSFRLPDKGGRCQSSPVVPSTTPHARSHRKTHPSISLLHSFSCSFVHLFSRPSNYSLSFFSREESFFLGLPLFVYPSRPRSLQLVLSAFLLFLSVLEPRSVSRLRCAPLRRLLGTLLSWTALYCSRPYSSRLRALESTGIRPFRDPSGLMR